MRELGHGGEEPLLQNIVHGNRASFLGTEHPSQGQGPCLAGSSSLQ